MRLPPGSSHEGAHINADAEYQDFLRRVREQRQHANNGYIVDRRGMHIHPDHTPDNVQLPVDRKAAHDERRPYIGREDHDLLHAYAKDDPGYQLWLDALHARDGCCYE